MLDTEKSNIESATGRIWTKHLKLSNMQKAIKAIRGTWMSESGWHKEENEYASAPKAMDAQNRAVGNSVAVLILPLVAGAAGSNSRSRFGK